MKELYTALSIQITELDADDVITPSSEGFWDEGWDDGDNLEGLLE